jgi:hypothetical protein
MQRMFAWCSEVPVLTSTTYPDDVARALGEDVLDDTDVATLGRYKVVERRLFILRMTIHYSASRKTR